MDDRILLAVATFSGIILHFLFGDYTQNLLILVMLRIIDFIFGLIMASMSLSKKSKNGGISSQELWNGLKKKVLTLLLVAVGHFVDVLLSINYIYNGMVVAFCFAECISMLEDYCIICPNPPPILTKTLEVLKKEIEEND